MTSTKPPTFSRMPKATPMTPFQIIGSGVKKISRKVGGFLDKQFVEPSRRVSRIKNAEMQEMDRKAKAGEFN
jgi:hypothetical protein